MVASSPVQVQSQRETSNQLVQVRPGNTAAVSNYSPDNGVTGIIKMIRVCNTTGTAATYRIHHHKDGTTFDQTTALAWDVSVAANSTDQIDCFIAIKNTGNLAFRTDTANALTFTAYGVEVE